MSLPEKPIININPINVLCQTDSNRPKWLCKHPYARVIDREQMLYSCRRCCKYGTVKIIADEYTVLRNLSQQPPVNNDEVKK